MERIDFIKSTAMDHTFHWVVLDEGLTQSIWSITATQRPLIIAPLTPLLNNVREIAPDFVILVDVDPNTSVKRTRERTTKHSRFDHIPPKKAHQLLEQGQEAFKIIANKVARNRQDHCILLSGHLPADENASTVIASLYQTDLIPAEDSRLTVGYSII
jgi:thymidylate kinase